MPTNDPNDVANRGVYRGRRDGQAQLEVPGVIAERDDFTIICTNPSLVA